MINDKHLQLAELFKTFERPTIIHLELSNERALIALHVPDNLSWFDWHFPDQKVLPGVVQIDWAGKFSRALFVGSCVFKQLTNIKFKTMVLPNTSMQLELIYDAEKANIKFHFFNAEDSFSMGSLKFTTQWNIALLFRTTNMKYCFQNFYPN